MVKLIESSLLVLCLDDVADTEEDSAGKEEGKEKEDASIPQLLLKRILHGGEVNASNRWYDNSLQVSFGHSPLTKLVFFCDF